jgi:hypothetical protein
MLLFDKIKNSRHLNYSEDESLIPVVPPQFTNTLQCRPYQGQCSKSMLSSSTITGAGFRHQPTWFYPFGVKLRDVFRMMFSAPLTCRGWPQIVFAARPCIRELSVETNQFLLLLINALTI